MRNVLSWVVGIAVGLMVVAATGWADGAKGELYEAAGHKYHVRLKIDAGAKKAVATLLDDKAKKTVTTAAKSIELRVKGLAETIKLDAVPSKDDKAVAFEFTGTSDLLA